MRWEIKHPLWSQASLATSGFGKILFSGLTESVESKFY